MPAAYDVAGFSTAFDAAVDDIMTWLPGEKTGAYGKIVRRPDCHLHRVMTLFEKVELAPKCNWGTHPVPT
jgi:hypothetical protein